MSVGTTVVELAGLPGSGKTTLAEALRDELHRAGVACTVGDAGISARVRKDVRTLRRAGYAMRELAGQPRASCRAAGVLVRSRQEARRDTAAVLAQWLATERLVSRARQRPGVRLLEEGLTQTAWTASLRAGRLCVDDLWACVPPGAHPDLVLYVDARPELAAERLTRRASRHSRLQRGHVDDLIGELRRGQALFDDLLWTSPMPVVRMSAAGASVETLVDQAVATLRDLRARTTVRNSDLR